MVNLLMRGDGFIVEAVKIESQKISTKISANQFTMKKSRKWYCASKLQFPNLTCLCAKGLVNFCNNNKCKGTPLVQVLAQTLRGGQGSARNIDKIGIWQLDMETCKTQNGTLELEF